jgi:hypothetical protein
MVETVQNRVRSIEDSLEMQSVCLGLAEVEQNPVYRLKKA